MCVFYLMGHTNSHKSKQQSGGGEVNGVSSVTYLGKVNNKDSLKIYVLLERGNIGTKVCEKKLTTRNCALEMLKFFPGSQLTAFSLSLCFSCKNLG